MCHHTFSSEVVCRNQRIWAVMMYVVKNSCLKAVFSGFTSSTNIAAIVTIVGLIVTICTHMWLSFRISMLFFKIKCIWWPQVCLGYENTKQVIVLKMLFIMMLFIEIKLFENKIIWKWNNSILKSFTFVIWPILPTINFYLNHGLHTYNKIP